MVEACTDLGASFVEDVACPRNPVLIAVPVSAAPVEVAATVVMVEVLILLGFLLKN